MKKLSLQSPVTFFLITMLSLSWIALSVIQADQLMLPTEKERVSRVTSEFLKQKFG